MTHPIGYYTNYDPQTKKPYILHGLQELFGDRFQKLTYEQKIVFRSALALYISRKPVWKEDQNVISLVDLCTEAAGVDWDIWEQDPKLCECIAAVSIHLGESDVEGLIQALTAQIKDEVYASRVEEWVVVNP
jgi:hypothetical protein